MLICLNDKFRKQTFPKRNKTDHQNNIFYRLLSWMKRIHEIYTLCAFSNRWRWKFENILFEVAKTTMEFLLLRRVEVTFRWRSGTISPRRCFHSRGWSTQVVILLKSCVMGRGNLVRLLFFIFFYIYFFLRDWLLYFSISLFAKKIFCFVNQLFWMFFWQEVIV